MTTGAQGAIERMIDERTPFEDIEHYIETLALPSAQLGALWLLAWAEATDPITRRRVVAEVLTGSNGLPGSPLAAAPGALAPAPHDEHRLASIRRGRSYSKRGGSQRRGTR
jgi:hypothetical protein